MSLRSRRLLSGLLSLLWLFLLLPTTALFAVAEGTFFVDYTFTGNEKSLAGFGEGVITITPPENSRTDGYYLLYFATDNAMLKPYDELASIPVTGHTVTHHVKKSTFIPPKATQLAVFESDTPFVKDVPSINDAVALIPIPAEKRPALGVAETSFGAVTDIHMNHEAAGFGAYRKWKKALAVFAERKTDFVVVAGDITGDSSDAPLSQQYQTYLDLIGETTYSPDNIYEAIGNHGNTAAGREQFVKYTAGEDEKHPFDGSPWFSVLKKGKTPAAKDNLFLFMAQELEAPGESAVKDNFSKEQIDWLEAQLANRRNANVFVILHAPFADYGPGDRRDGDITSSLTFKDDYPQTMRLKKLLEANRDVILLSGHTHLSLYDGENYADENGTSCRMIHLGAGSRPSSYGGGLKLMKNTDGRRNVTETYGNEGYTVTVYKDYIVFVGRNLATGKIIPSASYILPVKALPAPTKDKTDFYSTLQGSGTEKDPYLIEDAADFSAFTAAFNTGAGKQDEMFGNGQFFRQTADIDMRSIAGYHGTPSSTDLPYYFAGTYNGDGHTLTVDILGKGDRSVFPAVSGTICNLIIKGRITCDGTAQPVRTLRGNVINCLFDLELTAEDCASGVTYDNYGTMYNVYTYGTLIADSVEPIAAADSSFNYVNVYHFFNGLNGDPILDDYGIRSDDIEEITEVFNNRDTIQHQEAQALIGENEMTDLVVDDDDLGFVPGDPFTPTTTTEAVAAAPLISLPYSTWVMLLLVGILVMTVVGILAWNRFSKKY